MSIPTLAEIISKNYTGDVEGLESLASVVIAWSKDPVIEQSPMKEMNSVDSLTLSSYIEDGNTKLTKEEAMSLKETEKEYNESLAYIKDAIAPAMMRIHAT